MHEGPLRDPDSGETQRVATKAIVGEKVGMTQIWDDQHRAIPVTVLRVAPVRVVQVKTPEREGYSALQVTYGLPPRSHPQQARRAATTRRPGSTRAAAWSSCGSTTSATSRWASS